jgi:hypothetical protein
LADVLKVSAAWARCARDNGWPDIADPAERAGSLPEVVIPVTIASGQLDALLTACPPFDAAAFRAAQKAWAEGDTSSPAPAFPNLTVSPSDGSAAGEAARVQLLEQINQAQAEAIESA